MANATTTSNTNEAAGGEYLTFTRTPRSRSRSSSGFAWVGASTSSSSGFISHGGISPNAVTAIANTPAFIKGVVNLRGIIVPIVDLRIKFNLGNVDYSATTVVIILNLSNRVVGVVVDSVSDVLTLTPEQIKAAPSLSTSLDTQYITGLGTIDQRMLILVDIERLMSSRDMELMDEAVA